MKARLLAVRLKDGRSGVVAPDPDSRGGVAVVLEDGTVLEPEEAGALKIDADTWESAALVDSARTAGYRFAGLRTPAGMLSGGPSSPRRTAANQENGKKGGRPKKGLDRTER